MSAVKRSRGRPRSPESERAILAATLELLAELGYQRATVDAIAARAGASKSTIYRRWPTREELVIAAFAQTPPLVAPARGSAAERLVELMLQFARYMQSTPLGGVLPALVAERMHNPGLDRALAPLVAARRQPMMAILEQAIADGEIAAGIPAEFIADMISGPVLQRIMVIGARADRRYIRRVVDTVLAGLAATAGN